LKIKRDTSTKLKGKTAKMVRRSGQVINCVKKR